MSNLKVSMSKLLPEPVSKNKHYILMGSLLLNAALILNSTLSHQSQPQPEVQVQPSSPIANSIAHDLSAIQIELNKIQSAISQSEHNDGLNVVSSKVDKLSNGLAAMAFSQEKVKSFIADKTVALDQKLTEISQKVKKPKVQTKPSLVSQKLLPFRVESIDMVQEEGVVEVIYANRPVAIEVGDVIAGWKLDEVDYLSQKARFVSRDLKVSEVRLAKG